MKKEYWKSVVGFEGLYEVSSLGRVKSLGNNKFKKEKILKNRQSYQGYLVVNLYKNKKTYCKTIHRLVAEAFLPHPDNLPQVNHKDENKMNNCVENLEWCNAKYNTNYGTRNKNISKKNMRPVIQIFKGKIINVYNSMLDAEKIGFKHSGISECCNNKIKLYKGYEWQYTDEK